LAGKPPARAGPRESRAPFAGSARGGLSRAAMKLAAPPAPLRLAAACCAPELTSAQCGLIRDRAAGADWDVMLRLFRRHRIEGLAWRALSHSGVEMPADFAASLRERAERATATNMQAALVMARLQRRFAATGVDLLFIKGLTLGQLAYGNPLAKAAWDIDVLVGEGDVAAAAELLAAEGFACVIPEPREGSAGLLRWHATAKESVWRDEGGRVVELHDGLADHPMLIPGIGMASPRQDVTIGHGLAFPTLATPELYAYLAVHGGWSGWFRLKWLADVAALLSGRTAAEISDLHDAAEGFGAGRASALALLLTEWLFELPLAPELRERLAADRKAQALFRIVARALSGRFMLAELDQHRLGTWWMHRVQLGLGGGARYKMIQAGEEWRRAGRQVAKRLAPKP